MLRTWCPRFRPVLLALSLGIASSLHAQTASPRQRVISQLDAEYPAAFTCVRWGSIRELADGRLVVADPTEKRLELIDFRTGTGTPIGRAGAGPGEWGIPLFLSPFDADTTLLYDPQNNRLLRIAPDGTVGEQTIALAGSRAGLSLGGPRGYDGSGRLYYQQSSVTVVQGQPAVAADSAPIVRFDPRTSRVDTLLFIRVPRPEVRQGSNSSGQTQTVISLSPNPFLPRLAWTVSPDGRLALVNPEPYRIEWVGTARTRMPGPVTEYQRLRVTEADRNAPRDGGPACSFSVSRGNTSGAPARAPSGGVSVPRGGGTRAPARTDWPDFKPPFLGSDVNTLVASPSGEIWVPRARPAEDDVPLYDVFDARGRLSSRVSLPRGSRLLGFGRGVIYLSRMDADDLLYIQRWRMDGA